MRKGRRTRHRPIRMKASDKPLESGMLYHDFLRIALSVLLDGQNIYTGMQAGERHTAVAHACLLASNGVEGEASAVLQRDVAARYLCQGTLGGYAADARREADAIDIRGCRLAAVGVVSHDIIV